MLPPRARRPAAEMLELPKIATRLGVLGGAVGLFNGWAGSINPTSAAAVPLATGTVGSAAMRINPPKVSPIA